MAKFQGATYFTLKGGLNTEASALNIPPSDATDMSNVDINIDGSISRRRAIDFVGADVGGETYLSSSITDYNGVVEAPSYTQFNPTDDVGEVQRHIVLHLGDSFYFFDYSTPSNLKSINDAKQVVNTGFSDEQAGRKTTFLSDRNKLFVLNEKHSYGYFEYDADSDDFTWNDVVPQYRLNDSVGETSTKTNILKDTVAEGNIGFSTGCFSGSRVWACGASGWPNTVFFSQTVVDQDEYGYFYQDADPYDTTDNITVATDGGYITLLAAETILAVAPLGSGAIVFANNGVWSISGSDGFTATDYSISQISTNGIAGKDAWCQVEQQLVYYGNHNIYTILQGTYYYESPEVSAIGDKINTFYNTIPQYSLKASKAVYDPVNKKVFLLVNLEGYDWQVDNNEYYASTQFRSMLVFDVRLASFYRHDLALDEDGTKASLGDLSLFDGGAIEDINVTDGGVVVVDGDELVTTQNDLATNASYILNALILKQDGTSWKVGFGELATSGVTDFSSSADSEDVEYAEAYIKMAYQVFKDVAHKKFAPYLVPIFKRMESGTVVDGVDTTPGGCNYRLSWDFAVNSNSNKYGTLRGAYKPYSWTNSRYGGGDPGTDVVFSRLKIRGRGTVLRICFESDEDKDFRLYGWQIQMHAKGRI